MAPSSTSSNNATIYHPTLTTTTTSAAAMALVNNPDTAMTLLQDTSSHGTGSNHSSSSNNPPQIQGPSDSMPNANNMLVNGRGGGGAGSRAAAAAANGRPSISGAGGSSSPTMQKLPRPSSTARGNVAAFLTKLYNMVGDEGSNNLIKWSDDGHSFIVLKHVEFAKEVLPKFFKHNNFSSFVRQLNMYGFHKVPHLQQGVLLPDSDSEQWEFSNPHFQKNQPDLLCLVSRKKAPNGSEDKDALTMDLGHILQEVTAIKKHQIAISSDLKNIERDHQSLWQESVSARERHQRQQETIDKILRFLASVFSGEKKRAIVPNKKPRLTITDGDLDNEYETDLGHGLSEEEHEEEVTKLLGSKRKRASMVESEADYLLPGMESQGSLKTKPTFSMSEMTPATLALLANANQSAQSSLSGGPTLTATPSPATATTATPLSPAFPSISSASASLPNYLPSLPAVNYATQPFRLDPANLTIPTNLLPNGISPVHHDMLRSISMANAQETPPAPLPPSFAQTPAGANAVKGVDDITKEMEQLQRSIEALEAHGLNVDDFNFNNNYLDPAVFDTSAYGDLNGINGSGISYQDHLGNDNDAMDDMINTDQDEFGLSSVSTPLSSTIPASPATVSSSASSSPVTIAASVSTRSTAASTPIQTTCINPRTSTVGEEYLEDLLHDDPV
ncbi:stress-responsive transcription factor hsf1 [Dissophora ornata]|nr:stress-responsive transcription factor hsf1 [Dissophora ornata]